MRLLGEKGIDQASLTATGAEKGRWEERRQGQHKLLAGHREEEEEEISLTSAIRFGWMGEVREGRKRRETVPVGKRSPNLKANLTLQKSHRSSAVSKYTKPTGKHTPNTPANYTPSASGRGLWDAAGVGSPASDPRRGHRGATRTGVDGDGRVFFLSFFCGEKKK